MPADVVSAPIAVADRDLIDLRQRLANTRWPDRETVEDWSQGARLDRVRALVDYWGAEYDWRRCERRLNSFNPCRTPLDGLSVHFLHVRSPYPDALPLILTHGWPGSIAEFFNVIEPLVDPVRHGGDAADAFHVVVPSLPGYGFSDKPSEPGWTVERIARAWGALMRKLGYERFVAQGGDWGAAVTIAMGLQQVDGLAGIHLNMVNAGPSPDQAVVDPAEQALLDARGEFARWETGYSALQATRPQTLGYGLADSPAGQAAWIYEKFYAWTDCNGDPESVLSRDEILDNIMLYWIPNTGASSARLYWESFANRKRGEVHLPTGASIFPKELSRPPRHWAERIFNNIVYWNQPERGGHFAAFEQPVLFVNELRKCFRLMR